MLDRTAHLPTRDQALKRDTKALVLAAGGQAEAASFARRIKRQQSFSDYGAANVDQFMPIDAVRDLEDVTRGTPGWPHVTRQLASQQNCAVVILPDAEPSSGGFIAAMADLTKEYADVSGGLLGALADGHVCAADVRKGDLVAQADELIAVAVNIRAMLERIGVEGVR
jgi:hypothetical protein